MNQSKGSSPKESEKYLKAVFWDYPELCNSERVKRLLDQARASKDDKTVEWIMARFLERGRVKDTAGFFQIAEIKAKLNDLKISGRAKKRWRRLLEVYGNIA